MAVFEGKDVVLNYIDTVSTNFTHIQFRELVFTISHDESIVFLEAQGDFIAAKNVMPYCNNYVFERYGSDHFNNGKYRSHIIELAESNHKAHKIDYRIARTTKLIKQLN